MKTTITLGDVRAQAKAGAGPWAATGTLIGDSLTVQYNEIMQYTDVEAALYVLMP
jgi:hypothetical protein